MLARKSQSTPSGPQATPATGVYSLPVPSAPPPPNSTDWWSDRHALLLLTLLYTAQGLPMGLAFGSIPFLLKEGNSTYADLARFSLASLPYSLKLLIAPLVDSIYHPGFGRRKSWIVPAQLTVGLVAAVLADPIHAAVQSGNVALLSPIFMLLLALTATQDIAVDGWSLTMLSKSNVEYASTCQSLGISVGFFSTFTIFLAFSNPGFCDNYVRPLLPWSAVSGPIVDLRSALQLMGLFYLCLTVYISFFKREQPDDACQKKTDLASLQHERLVSGKLPQRNSDLSSAAVDSRLHQARSATLDSIKATYSDLLTVVRKPAVRSLIFILLTAKVGFSAYDNVSTLKLLEVGFSKETMASMAVIQTPFTLLATVVTGRLVAKKSPTKIYLCGFLLRFLLSLTGPPCIALLKSRNGVVTPGYYVLILILTISYTFAAECLMFIGMGALFLNISSSSVHVAGSYLTLLNTCSNMGGTWHKVFVLWLVDQLTWRTNCTIPLDSPEGTLCPILYDGYNIISLGLIPVAVVAGLHIFRTLPKLGRLPDSAWRAAKASA